MAIIVSLASSRVTPGTRSRSRSKPIGHRSKTIVLSYPHRPAGGLVVGAASGAADVWTRDLFMPRGALDMGSVM
jgi:hypothetical protein